MVVEKNEMAWPSGDSPGPLNFGTDVPHSIRALILEEAGNLLGVQRDILGDVKALSRSDGLSGRFWIKNGNDEFFMKITNRLGSPDIESDILKFTQEKGAKVNPIIAHKLFTWQGKKYRIEIRPFIEGRHFNGSIEDIISIAKNLNQLHACLKYFPDKESVYQNAFSKAVSLNKIKKELRTNLTNYNYDLFKENIEWGQLNKNWLTNLVENYNPFICDHERAQCLHGEIHPGNVIFDKHGNAVFADFEESTHSYAPIEWDVAYAVQRFCLKDNPNQETLINRLNIFEKSYGNFYSLWEPMRAIAWYCVLTILHLRNKQNIVVPKAEYDKFVILEKQADALKNFL